MSGNAIQCGSTASQSITIEDYGYVKAEMNATNDTVKVLPNSNYIITNTSMGSGTISWIIDNILQSHAPSFTFNSGTLGYHTVMMIIDNGLCADTTYGMIEVDISIGKIEIKKLNERVIAQYRKPLLHILN